MPIPLDDATGHSEIYAKLELDTIEEYINEIQNITAVLDCRPNGGLPIT